MKNEVSPYLIRFSLILFLSALAFGVIAAIVFISGGALQPYLPFERLRPLHVSAAVFWILTAATGSVMHYAKSDSLLNRKPVIPTLFLFFWAGSITLILFCFVAGKFGGREYWEYPPILSIPLLFAWMLFAIHFFGNLRSSKPVPAYKWMWATGAVFFVLTFLESNLWLIPWFRFNVIRDISVQWKSNGAIVGSWNMLVYGISLYLMEQISGDQRISRRPLAYFLYFLGLFNLLFNWGHHIYPLPAAEWIRHVSYVVSMTEWIILLNIIRLWRSTLSDARRHMNQMPYMFLLASEFWVFLNLLLALLMSIPVLNLYTHGTHVTVAHAMGTTIGINSMILLASIIFIAQGQNSAYISHQKRKMRAGFWLANSSLLIFWISLIIAGIVKGYYQIAEHKDFNFIVGAISPWLLLFTIAGVGVATGLVIILIVLLRARYKAMTKISYQTDDAHRQSQPVLSNFE